MPVHLIASETFLRAVALPAGTCATAVAAEALDDARWGATESALAHGDSLIAVGATALSRLRPLWVATHDCPPSDLRGNPAGLLPVPPTAWRPCACRGICLRPDALHAYFGQDEMPCAELIPLVEALGASGDACGYAAACLKHTAPSLVGGRFGGSNWYLFAFDDPLTAATADEWTQIIESLCGHASARLTLTDAATDYACYRRGETVRANLRVANHSADLAAVRIEVSARSPNGTRRTSRWIRRCLNGHEEVVVPWEFAPADAPGLWRVRAELHAEDRFVYGAARATESRLVESAECAFVLAGGDFTQHPRPMVQGRALSVQGHDGFLAGTHYYPSSSWWDWAWRGFRPDKAARDLGEMARLGYRLVRVWIDPELDEQALRGLEAWLHLSAAHGIVSIVCVFTQWARHLSYPDGEGMTTFEFMGPADLNLYSVQLSNIEHQQRYVATLARRWKSLPGVVWNLATEAFIVDPSPEQMDATHFADVEPREGPHAGAAFFNRWADLMTEALREAGAAQPILRGYGFINGGDCYLQNRTGDLLVWHHYAPPEIAGPCLALADPGALDKPLLLEEFGIPTLDEAERLERYEGVACWAAVMGVAGACSYEWGVSWLTRELPYVATPLRDGPLVADPDPRWMRGSLDYAATWPLGTMGLCPWAASFSYGSNFPCTPFPTPAAAALGEVARFCADIGPPVGTEAVLLVVPMEFAGFVPLMGYQRQLAPVWQTIHALAAAHVPFTVIQEDQLGDCAARPQVVIFPASQRVRPETQAHLDALVARGVAVHIGSPESCRRALARHAIPLESGAPVWCLRRGTRDGSLYMLFAPGGPTWLRLRDGDGEVRLDISRYALVEITRSGEVRRFVGRATAPTEVNPS